MEMNTNTSLDTTGTEPTAEIGQLELSQVEMLLEGEDYAAAAAQAGKILENVEAILATVAQAGLRHGQALLLTQAITTTTEETNEISLPDRQVLEKAWNSFQLSQKLNPTCQETRLEIKKLTIFYRAMMEGMVQQGDFAQVAKEANRILHDLQSGTDLETIAKVALLHGKALLMTALREMSETGKIKNRSQVLHQVWDSLQLSHKLDPDCEQTMQVRKKLSGFYQQVTRHQTFLHLDPDVDVLIVGAGAAGVGTALMLTQTFGLDGSRVLMIERGHIGQSFYQWPAEMRFISPSFNQQGWTQSYDLNAVMHGTSPAYSLHTQHPSGVDYAAYLQAMAGSHQLRVRQRTEVVSVTPVGETTGSTTTSCDDATTNKTLFSVKVRSVPGNELHHMGKAQDDDKNDTETITARYVVWAAGEFQYPRGGGAAASAKSHQASPLSDTTGNPKTEPELQEPQLPGADLCLHNSQVRSWADLEGDSFVIIGGYESGIDAAINLAKAGKRTKVLAATSCWSRQTTDPSAELAPYTIDRLREVLAPTFPPRVPNPPASSSSRAVPTFSRCIPEFYAPVQVVRVEQTEKDGGGFLVTAKWKAPEQDSGTAPLRNAIPTQEPGAEGDEWVFHTDNPPILCTGFQGSVAAAASHLFKFADGTDKNKCMVGAPLLTSHDESTIHPGVFLVGPTVSHGDLSFCFIYKFRQRFAVVAAKICQGLGVDCQAAVAECRQNNMYLDNFSCCNDTCGEVC